MTAAIANPVSPAADTRSPVDTALFARPAAGDDRRANFASVLGKIQQREDETPDQFARRSAESFVSLTLVQPILKKLRETSQAAPPFAPTDAEKQFRGLADAELAQRIVHAAHFPLVDRVTQWMLDKSAARATVQGAPKA